MIQWVNKHFHLLSLNFHLQYLEILYILSCLTFLSPVSDNDLPQLAGDWLGTTACPRLAGAFLGNVRMSVRVCVLLASFPESVLRPPATMICLFLSIFAYIFQSGWWYVCLQLICQLTALHCDFHSRIMCSQCPPCESGSRRLTGQAPRLAATEGTTMEAWNRHKLC